MARQQMVAVHCAGGDPASPHHFAEGNGGSGRDDHFALMKLGDHVGQQVAGALVDRGHARRAAARRGRKDCRGDGRRRGAESAGAKASMASTPGLLDREKTGKFLLARDVRRVSQFSNEQTSLLHSICGNINSCLVNVSRYRKLVVA